MIHRSGKRPPSTHTLQEVIAEGGGKETSFSIYTTLVAYVLYNSVRVNRREVPCCHPSLC